MSYLRLSDLAAVAPSAPMTRTEYETYQGLIKNGLSPDDAKAQVYSTRTGEAPRFFSGGFTTAQDQALTAAFDSAAKAVQSPADQITSVMNKLLDVQANAGPATSPLVYVAVGAGALGLAGLAWWALSGREKSVAAKAELQPA